MQYFSNGSKFPSILDEYNAGRYSIISWRVLNSGVPEHTIIVRRYVSIKKNNK